MWKNLQKRFQSPDSFVSLILGLAVVLVVGTLIYNYVSSRGTSLLPGAGQQQGENQGGLPLTHTVVAGDTLWSIAIKYYSDGYKWADIAKANTLANADGIEVGQKLTIPAVSPAPTSQVSPTGQTSSTATQVTPPSKSYTVVAGDNLWNIAVAQYGSGYKWVDIARANNLANPDIIHAGNVFILP